MLNGTNRRKKIFILGGLIIHHYFTLGQKIWQLNKIAVVYGNRWKVANYAKYQTKFIVQHLAHFWSFLGPFQTN